MYTININSRRALPVAFRACHIEIQVRPCIHLAYGLFSVGFARVWLFGFWAFYRVEMEEVDTTWTRLVSALALALALASEDDPRTKARIGGLTLPFKPTLGT